MDAKLALQVVGGRLDDLDALRDALHDKLGAEPSLNMRLEIVLGPDRIVVTATDTAVTVLNEATGEIIAQGNHEVARAAIKGLASEA